LKRGALQQPIIDVETQRLQETRGSLNPCDDKVRFRISSLRIFATAQTDRIEKRF